MIETILWVIDDVWALDLAARDELVVADLLLGIADQAGFAKEMLASYRVEIFDGLAKQADLACDLLIFFLVEFDSLGGFEAIELFKRLGEHA